MEVLYILNLTDIIGIKIDENIGFAEDKKE